MRLTLLSFWFLGAIVACSSTPITSGDCPADATLVVLTDYSSSGVGTFERGGATPALFFGAQLGGDPVLARSGGRSFFVARDRSTLFELNRCGRGVATISTKMAGDPAQVDPQDVAVLPDGSLLVPRWLVPSALVIDAHGAPRKTIDFSSFDVDGNPNMSAATMTTLDGKPKALVVLERLDDTTSPPRATRTGVLAIVDATTLEVQGSIDLGARNPFGHVIPQETGVLWFAAVGDFSSATDAQAGIVRFDPKTRDAKIVVAEAALGGSVVDLAFTRDGTCAVALLADASAVNRTWLVTFDPNSGAIGKTVMGPTTGFDLSGMAWLSDGSFVVGDRRQRPGMGYPLHVMTRSGVCELTAAEDIMMPMPPGAFGP